MLVDLLTILFPILVGMTLYHYVKCNILETDEVPDCHANTPEPREPELSEFDTFLSKMRDR